ncbi:MAG: LysM peptidoglycan-binding domain-containing protein [Anaerolineae bacterium]
MPRLIRFICSTLALGLLALGLAACVPGAAELAATPTIVRLPAETRAAVATAEALRRFGGNTPMAGAASTTATPTPEISPTATATAPAAPDETPETPTPTAAPVVEVTVTPTAAQPSPTALPAEHVVQWGENLTVIARRYGVTVRALAEANGITNPSAIYVGQVLVIPTPAPATVTPTPTPTVAATAQPISRQGPAGGRIAFQVASGGEIWAVGADGTGLQRLTTGLDPAWSPDGRQLAFARWEEPRGLYVLDVASGQERLVRGQNLVKSPTWSPDGDRLAFTWESSGAAPTRLCFPGFGCFELPGQVAWSLTVVDQEGNTVSDPTADRRSFSPSWSPVGDWIAYQGENGLKATEVGGQPWVILDDVAAVCPEVSPDGQRVAFMYRQHDHWEVYTVGSDGSGLQALTQSSPLAERPAQNVAPTWSPDGTQILFLSDRDGRWRPYIMAADGSDQRPFLPEVFDQFTFQYDFAAERVFTWR